MFWGQQNGRSNTLLEKAQQCVFYSFGCPGVTVRTVEPERGAVVCQVGLFFHPL